MKRNVFFISLWLLIFLPAVSAQEIRDVHPPVDPPANFLLVLILALLLIALMAVPYLLKRLRRLKPVVELPAWRIAENQLAQLQAEDLPGQGRIKEFYTRLSDIVRRYLEAQLNIRAPEMTSFEFFVHIRQASELSQEQKDALKNFLDCCDMVKFAKYASNAQETQESFALALRFIEETKIKQSSLSSAP